MPFVSSVRGSYGPQSKTKRNGNLFMISGGSVSLAGGYRTHTFTTVGTSALDVGAYGFPITVEALIIGGGGGGGYSCTTFLLSDILTSTVSVTINGGGAANNAGGNITFGSYLTHSGGGGGFYYTGSTCSNLPALGASGRLSASSGITLISASSEFSRMSSVYITTQAGNHYLSSELNSFAPGSGGNSNLAGGSSVFGGNGGTGVTSSSAGVAPGGGGGGNGTTAGAGAIGRVIVTVF